MSGLRNSPEENLLLAVMGAGSDAALWIGGIALVLSVIIRNREVLQPFPSRKEDRMPWPSLAVLAAFWMAVAIYPQGELRRNHQVEQLIKAGEYKQALRFLSSHEERSFAPARQLPPKPYEYEVFEELPKLLNAMDGSEALWVRTKYLGYLEIMMSHHWRFHSETNFANLVSGLKKIPEGKTWLSSRAASMNEHISMYRDDTKTLLLWDDLVKEWDLQIETNSPPQ